jgi:hypothetical protein|tara:strand:+ start:284 stop:571 length:288 start_codon:yes stop_codon:yes gene_type:complete
MNNKTKKDELFDRAQELYGKKLDRRLSLSDLSDQVERMEAMKDKAPVIKPTLIPAKVQNVITGNIFEYNDLFKGNSDLQVIEWKELDEAEENGNN